MNSLFHEFYVQPMIQVYLESLAMYVLWTILMLALKNDRIKHVVGIIGVVCASTLIICFTILNRSSGLREYCLIPFVTFLNAKTQPEFYRTMYMNVLLFIPLGLSLPFVLPSCIKHKVLFAILIGFLISTGVEAAQFVFCIGRGETDDVIMNIAGVVIGTTSYLFCNSISTIHNLSPNLID